MISERISIDAETARFVCDYAKANSPFRANTIVPTIAAIAKGKSEFLVKNLARVLINHLDAAGELSFDMRGWSGCEKQDSKRLAIQTSYQQFIVDTVIAVGKAEGPDRDLDAQIDACIDIFGLGGPAPEFTADRELVWETAKYINPYIHSAGEMDGDRYVEYFDGATVGLPAGRPGSVTETPFITTRLISGKTPALAACIAMLMLLYVQVSVDLQDLVGSDDVPLQPDHSNLSPEGYATLAEREAELDRLVEERRKLSPAYWQDEA